MVRWWDGARWTEQTAPAGEPAPSGGATRLGEEPGDPAQPGAWPPAPAKPGPWPPAKAQPNVWPPAPAQPNVWSPAPAASGGPPKVTLWAVASLVLGLIGGSVLAIIFGFVARTKIKRSGGTLRGKGIATAGIVLGILWLALIAVLLVLAAAGVLEDTNAEKFSGGKKPIAQAIDDFEAALKDSDEDRVCDELLTPDFKARLSESSGKPCADVFSEEEGRQAELKVKRIALAGSRATAYVNEGGEDLRVVYVRSGARWLVDDLIS